MSDRVGVPVAFDEDVVIGTAADHDVSTDRLATLLAEHQAGVEDLPGVENLVYEWRKHFDGVVLERTAESYYVAAPPWVWDEFGDRLAVTDAECRALAAAHDRQVRASVDRLTDTDRALLVLDR